MKRNIFLTIALILTIILTYQCKCDRHSNKKVTISGQFLYSKGETLYIEQINPYENILLDSVIIKESGNFSFSIKPEEATFIVLRTTKQNSINLLVEHKENIQLSGDIRSLPATYTVNGSPGSLLLQELHKNTFQNYILLDSLAIVWEKKKYDNNKLEVRDSLDSIALSIYEQQKQFVIDFVNKNPNSLASIMALYQTFGQVPVVDEFENISLFQLVVQELQKQYPSNSHMFELSSRVERNKYIMEEQKAIKERMQAGNKIPEISLADYDGKPISIIDYEGQVRIIYFWSSQCASCRKNNAEINKIIKKYENKSLMLYTVSLDFDKEIWKKAYELDKLKGVHVSDLKEWHSPIVKTCNVTTIPYIIVIDKEGKIVKTGVNIDELEEVVKNIL